MRPRHGGFDRSYYVRDYNRNFAVREHSLDDEPLPAVEPGSGYYSSTAIAERALSFLEEHERGHGGDPFFLYLAFIAPHFPLHAPRDDIAFYRGRYEAGWDAIRRERWDRMRDMGLLDCGLSPRQSRVKPRWNLPEEELVARIGEGEAGRAVSWRYLSDEQKSFQARKMEVHAAMVHRLDRETGRVVEHLRATGRMENTLILFVSDNGASAEQIIRGDGHDKRAEPGSAESFLCLGPGWSTASNTPFRYHKSWVHEGGVASPLIVHWPVRLRGVAGELRHTPGHFVDLAPTILDVSGADEWPAWRGQTAPPFAGVSLAPALDADVDIEREPMFFRHIRHRALRDGRWKLVAVRWGAWELYDMATDRSELRNLAGRYPGRVRRMAAEWQRRHEVYIRQAGEVRD